MWPESALAFSSPPWRGSRAHWMGETELFTDTFRQSLSPPWDSSQALLRVCQAVVRGEGIPGRVNSIWRSGNSIKCGRFRLPGPTREVLFIFMTKYPGCPLPIQPYVLVSTASSMGGLGGQVFRVEFSHQGAVGLSMLLASERSPDTSIPPLRLSSPSGAWLHYPAA